MRPSLAVACVLALAPWAARAQTAAPAAPPPDCWIDHSQVQPSRADGAPAAETLSRLMTDKHAGAEHLPRVTRLPPCSAEPPREGAPRREPVGGGEAMVEVPPAR